MKSKFLVPLLALVFLAGCETRSISNSGYHSSSYWRHGSSNPFYNGELSEFDILGTAPAVEATEANIAQALAASAHGPSLKRGEKVLLIQSGALVPDHAMLDEVSKYFDVAPFSGVPPEKRENLSASLRLRAAQGGYRHLVCYWGVLESAQLDREGKAVSWVPFAGAFVPDQKQQMRIRLKAVVLDVASGSWRMLTPEAHADENLNSRRTREAADQRLVEDLKQKGYRSLVGDLLKT